MKRWTVTVLFGLTISLIGHITCGATQAQDAVHSESYKTDRQAFDLLKEGISLSKEGHRIEARASLEQAAALDPTPYSAPIHENLALIDSDLGNLNGALSENELALKFDPSMSEAAWNAALALKDLGDYQQAITWVERYIDIKSKGDPNRGPNLQDAYGLIKKLQEQAGNQYLTNPNSPDYLQQLISAHGVSMWPSNQLPLQIFVDSGKNVEGYSTVYFDYLHHALDSWCKAAQGRLAYQFVDKKKKANVIVEFTSNAAEVTPKDGVHMEQGIAIVQTMETPQRMPIIRCAVVKILTVSRTTGKPLGDDEVKEVCLHEIGHMLGLGGHSNNSADIMYFSVSARQLPGLTWRDKATIARLYGSYPERFHPQKSAD